MDTTLARDLEKQMVACWLGGQLSSFIMLGL